MGDLAKAYTGADSALLDPLSVSLLLGGRHL
jgi:hypothetical protein